MQGTPENEPDQAPVGTLANAALNEPPNTLVHHTNEALVGVQQCLSEAAEKAIAGSIYGVRSDWEIQGRVDQVREGTTNWFMTLGAGAQGDETSFTASVSRAKAVDRPVVGSAVAIKGRFVVRRGIERRLSANVEFRAWQYTVVHYPEPREIPKTPRVLVTKPFDRVGLVTAKESAGDGDFAQVLKESGLGDLIKIVPEYVRLEGGTFEEIATAIRSFTSRDVGLVVVTRGGGPKAMLRRFDHPDIVDAIADVAAMKPVMVAIGHWDDWVRANTYAAYSALTPSDAAHKVANLYRQTLADARLARGRQIRRRVTRGLLIAAAALALLIGAHWAVRSIFEMATQGSGPAEAEPAAPERKGPPKPTTQQAPPTNRNPTVAPSRVRGRQVAPAVEPARPRRP